MIAVVISLVSLCIAFCAAYIAAMRMPEPRVRDLYRQCEELRDRVTECEELLLKQANRDRMRKVRAGIDGDGIPDSTKDPEGWKRAMRLRHLTPTPKNGA